MPEKTNIQSNGFELFSNLFSSVCKSMQITSPFHQTEKSWLFVLLFDLLRFILYYFCESMILSCEFTLLKGENSKKPYICDHGNTDVRVYFTFSHCGP